MTPEHCGKPMKRERYSWKCGKCEHRLHTPTTTWDPGTWFLYVPGEGHHPVCPGDYPRSIAELLVDTWRKDRRLPNGTQLVKMEYEFQGSDVCEVKP